MTLTITRRWAGCGARVRRAARRAVDLRDVPGAFYSACTANGGDLDSGGRPGRPPRRTAPSWARLFPRHLQTLSAGQCTQIYGLQVLKQSQSASALRTGLSKWSNLVASCLLNQRVKILESSFDLNDVQSELFLR